VFHQYAASCLDHPSCTVISCVTDADIAHPHQPAVLHPRGSVVWTSHLDGAIHVSHRVNPGVAASDLRHDGRAVSWEPVCPECAAHPAWPA
jgi:hypothetical protein